LAFVKQSMPLVIAIAMFCTSPYAVDAASALQAAPGVEAACDEFALLGSHSFGVMVSLADCNSLRVVIR
jgi:hypothetical protein